MIKSFLIIVLIAGASFVHMDIHSPCLGYAGAVSLRIALDQSPGVTPRRGAARAARLGRCGHPEA
jgi:hypothetical protein